MKGQAMTEKKIDYKIKDDTQYTNQLTIVYYDHNDLNKFKILSGKLAVSNEYQCHYFALVRTEDSGNCIIRQVFPLIYYNYKQQVSGATVDFEMDDVREVAKQLALTGIVKAKKNALIERLNHLKPIYPDAKISYKVTFFNNIHRHP